MVQKRKNECNSKKQLKGLAAPRGLERVRVPGTVGDSGPFEVWNKKKGRKKIT